MPVFICGAFKDMRSSCIERLCSNWLWHKQPKFNRPTQKLQWNNVQIIKLWYINTVQVSLHQIQNTFFIFKYPCSTNFKDITTLLISILHRIANKTIECFKLNCRSWENKVAFLVQSIKTWTSRFCAMTKRYVLTSTFLWSVKNTKVGSKWHKQKKKNIQALLWHPL